MAIIDTSKWLTLKEAGAILEWSAQTVARRIREGAFDESDWRNISGGPDNCIFEIKENAVRRYKDQRDARR